MLLQSAKSQTRAVNRPLGDRVITPGVSQGIQPPKRLTGEAAVVMLVVNRSRLNRDLAREATCQPVNLTKQGDERRAVL
jgi:hypothetical protein